jgi:hypothetical protein
MQTLSRTDHFDVPAPAERVFPLLCPIREYDWIPTWKCELFHSVSSVAEEDCIFRTDNPADGRPMTWVVSRYEPPRRIEFTCFVADLYVMRLKIGLSPQGDTTRLEWTRRWLSLGPEGDRWIAAWSEAAYRRQLADLERLLTHYLRTGEMLRS